MSAFDSRPLYYNQTEKNTVLEETQKNNIKWEMWYKTLTGLNFEDKVAKAYATIFVNNNVANFSMTHDLNNDTLKSMGIDRAEYRMKILHMKLCQLYANMMATTQSSLQASTQSATTIQHCSQHLDTTAIDKCHRCKEPVCFDCREQLTLDPGLVTYCQKCIDDVSCTIQ